MTLITNIPFNPNITADVFYDCINQILGPRLNKHFVNAKLFGFAWTEAAELEFNFLLNSERYTPFNEVFKALFYRTLWMSGIEDPRSFATDEERDLCQAAFSRLELRPGCREMMAKLRENGFTIWCLTTGDKARVKGYFDRAGFEMPIESVVSCDSFVDTDANGNKLGTGVYKPSMGAYRPMLAKFADEDEKWFAAAHMWDVSAAVKAG